MRAKAVALSALVLTAVSSSAVAGPLFPTPLHITRQVHDPISGKTAVISEYGHGNRLVSVRGNRSAIADYDKGELIEIDRDAATYSITRFEIVARATKLSGFDDQNAKRDVRPQLSPGAVRATKSGRAAEFFESEVDAPAGKQKFVVAVDRSVRISRDALEVLLGSAYPNARSAQHDVVLAAAAPARLAVAADSVTSSADQSYALPLEQIIEYGDRNDSVEFRNSIVRIGNEPPPAETVTIPAGARLVISRIAAVVRELEMVDTPPQPFTTKP